MIDEALGLEEGSWQRDAFWQGVGNVGLFAMAGGFSGGGAPPRGMPPAGMPRPAATTAPPRPAPISMDKAVALGAAHVGGKGKVVTSGSGGVQFINKTVNADGQTITKITRFDINPDSE